MKKQCLVKIRDAKETRVLVGILFCLPASSLLLTSGVGILASASILVADTELGYWRMDTSNDNVPASGQTQDLSGNGLHLTKNGGPTTRNSLHPRFGQGYVFDAIDDHLQQTSSSLGVMGDLSLVVAFERDNLLDEMDIVHWGALGETAATNHRFMLRINPDDTLRYFHEYGSGSDVGINSLAKIGPGFHTLTLRRDIAANTVEIKLDGTPVIGGLSPISGSFTTDPDGGDSGSFIVGKAFYGGIFELRIWDELLDQTTLEPFHCS